MSSFRGAQQWVSQPTKLPSLTDAGNRKCCCDQICPECYKGNASLTTYRNDYQVWKTFMRQPYKHVENLKIPQGVNLDDNMDLSMEKNTSYKTSFVPHPVQLHSKLDKPRLQASSFQLGQPCHSVVHHQRPWTSGAKLSRDTDFFLSTTHADYTQHTLERTVPIIQGRQSSLGRSKAPFEGTTTMREAFKKWDLPRRPSTAQKDKKDWMKGYDSLSFSTCSNKDNHCSKCCNHRDNSVFECARTSGSVRKRATWMRCDPEKEQSQKGQCLLHPKVPQSASSFRNKNHS